MTLGFYLSVGLCLLVRISSHVATGSYSCSYACANSYGTCTMYCDNGCCGELSNRYCCSNFTSIGTIAGAIIGGIVCLAVILSIIAFCIVHCQKRQHRHSFVQPTNRNLPQYSQQNNNFYGQPPKPATVPVPPPYSTSPPPGYADLYPQDAGFNDPAYPPATAGHQPQRIRSPAPPYQAQSGPSGNQGNSNIWTVQSLQT